MQETPLPRLGQLPVLETVLVMVKTNGSLTEKLPFRGEMKILDEPVWIVSAQEYTQASEEDKVFKNLMLGHGTPVPKNINYAEKRAGKHVHYKYTYKYGASKKNFRTIDEQHERRKPASSYQSKILSRLR